MTQPRDTLVLNLLQQNWNPANTFGLTPDISYGWYDESAGQPQLTIGSEDETPGPESGPTGYDTMTPLGEPPNQSFTGTIDIHCWGRNEDLSGASTGYAQQYFQGDGDNLGAREELRRIIRENGRAPVDPVTGNRPVNLIGPLGGREVPEDDPGSRVIHYIEQIGYGYRTQ